MADYRRHFGAGGSFFLVARVADWPCSSFHRMVRLGVDPEDWAGDVSGHDGEFGEQPQGLAAR